MTYQNDAVTTPGFELEEALDGALLATPKPFKEDEQ